MIKRDADTGPRKSYHNWHKNVERPPKNTRDADTGPSNVHGCTFKDFMLHAHSTRSFDMFVNISVGEILFRVRRA